MPAHVDLSGATINGILVLSVSHVNWRHEYFYHAECSCGMTFVVSGDKLKRGHTKSCGCIQNNLKHGMTLTSEYRIWAAMKSRCLNKNNHAYKYYGARGITVCERWLQFKNFYADMGNKPVGKSIDRIDNDGPYSPENCRWSTPKEQSNNRRPRGSVMDL